MKATSIGDIVKAVFSNIEGKKGVLREELELIWNELVGHDGAKHSRPTSLRKEILTVTVDSSAWLQELAIQKRNFLKALKRKLGKDRISEIHFKIGEL